MKQKQCIFLSFWLLFLALCLSSCLSCLVSSCRGLTAACRCSSGTLPAASGITTDVTSCGLLTLRFDGHSLRPGTRRKIFRLHKVCDSVRLVCLPPALPWGLLWHSRTTSFSFLEVTCKKKIVVAVNINISGRSVVCGVASRHLCFLRRRIFIGQKIIFNKFGKRPFQPFFSMFVVFGLSFRVFAVFCVLTIL